ncbi:hypothetical protein HJC23_013874 [Cyclotella cryptica]|uniref:Uncharacterized protein n=1 Tax=Cyclotella cryptica TaxID=29204 RepID=A0ABD3QG92_9STRA
MPTLNQEFPTGKTTRSTRCSDGGWLQAQLKLDEIIGEVQRGYKSATSPSCDLSAQTTHVTTLMLTPTTDFKKWTEERWKCPAPPRARRAPMIIRGKAAVVDGQHDIMDLSSGITVVGTVNSKAVEKNRVSLFDDGTREDTEYRNQVKRNGKGAEVRFASEETQRAEETDRCGQIKEKAESKTQDGSQVLSQEVANANRRRIEQEEHETESRAAAEKKQIADATQGRRQIADNAGFQRGAKDEKTTSTKEAKAEVAMAQAEDATIRLIEQDGNDDASGAPATEDKPELDDAERRCQIEGETRLRKRKGDRILADISAIQKSAKKRKVDTNHKSPQTKNGLSAEISYATKMQPARLPSLAKAILKPLFEVNDKVFAPWWPNAKRKCQPSWYSGVITGYNIVEKAGDYGPTRHYSVRFDDDNEELRGINDAYVFSFEDYKLSMFDQNGDSGKTRWVGVKNVTDVNSRDLWAKVVGWYEASIGEVILRLFFLILSKTRVNPLINLLLIMMVDQDGETHSFSTLSGALRAYDAHVIAKKGDKAKKFELNLPNERVHEIMRSK